MRAALAFVLVASAAGCSDDGVALFVDVRGDLVPGVEFTAIRTELVGADVTVERAVFLSTPFAEGVRAAELGGLEPGTHDVVVSLLDVEMQVVVARDARVEVRGATAATLVMSRRCAEVECPSEGDDSSFTECVGNGECGPPTCTVEQPEACPSAACEDVDCEFVGGCADGRCVEGVCLARTLPGACAPAEYCDPERGCVRLPSEPDAGAPCGPCGDGSDGVYAPSADEALPGGLHQFASVTIPAGVTITVDGDQPLQVFSQGPVRVDGVLELSGGSASAAGSCSSAPRRGGQGVAGGGDGGSSGTNGEVGTGPGGGLGGRRGSAGSGGGGGASAMGAANGAADSGGQSGGPAGAPYDAIVGAGFLGGSGGGGGAGDNAGTGSGGGGGAGGGALLIAAETITIGAAGAVRANGGNGAIGGGAGALTACDGGGGGGGSGGTVWLRAATVTLDGSVEANGGGAGATGPSGTGNTPGAGGVGAPGQIRVDALDVTGTTTPPFEAGPSPCGDPLCGGG